MLLVTTDTFTYQLPKLVNLHLITTSLNWRNCGIGFIKILINKVATHPSFKTSIVEAQKKKILCFNVLIKSEYY